MACRRLLIAALGAETEAFDQALPSKACPAPGEEARVPLFKTPCLGAKPLHREGLEPQKHDGTMHFFDQHTFLTEFTKFKN